MMNKWTFKQVISVLLALVLVVGLLPHRIATAEGINEKSAAEDINKGTGLIQGQTDGEVDQVIEEINDEENVSVEYNDEEIVVETKVEFEEEVFEEVPNEATSVYDIENAQVALSVNHETNDIILKSIEKDVVGNEVEKEYKVDVETATEEEIVATFTDVATGQEFKVDSNELQASFVWFLVPVGVVIGEVLLAHLISAGLAIVISGVAYLAVAEFLKRPKTKSHYTAVRKSSGLFIGNGITHAKAASRLKSGADTWSTSKSNAQSVAKAASPISKALGPEIDKSGKGKLYHYHPISGYKQGVSVRMGSHAFYGSPR
ncbi:SAR2788 family putative toxin [Peribacillus frigoritolerans]|uniref:SAR2788 family putative toxin n=1 Tax=Peribacillus frigoritolerans TaxID=450367 RepID=UPI003B8D9BD7